MKNSPNGDHREETIAEYLAEADRCEKLASRASDKDREAWIELAERWRRIATRVKTGG